MSVEDDWLIGTVISERYRVLELLGAGAMGRVYRARHELMRKDVAIKVLRQDHQDVPEIVERFEREALAAAHISHPHVASATDFGQLSDGSFFLVLEYVQGPALSEVIAQEGSLAPARALKIAYQIASALEAAHAQGIIHRDLKPDNILLTQSAEGDHAKVTDFGIARVPKAAESSGKTLTQAGMVYGTPEYMAPEQALGQVVDERADLFSLGMVLYEMLAGKRPYEGPVATLLGQQLTTPLPALEERGLRWELSPTARSLVVRLLDKDAKARPARVAEVLLDLNVALSEQLPLAGQALAEAPRSFRERLLSRPASSSPGSAGRSSSPAISSKRSPSAARIESRPPEGSFAKTQHPRGKRRFGWGAVAWTLSAGAAGVALTLLAFSLSAESSHVAHASTSNDVAAQERVTEERIRAAEKEGLAGLEALADQLKSDPLVAAHLAKQLMVEHQYERGMQEASRALELDPALNEYPALRGALFRAAQTQQVGFEALRFLRTAMGESGIDILYDLAHLEDVNISTRTRVAKMLLEPEVQASASEALRATLVLNSTLECPALSEALQAAKEKADERALPRLAELEALPTCPDAGCSPCLSPTPQEVRATIQARSSAK